jgi:hypothetical protein
MLIKCLICHEGKPLSYQPLQSLELDEEKIKKLCADTVEAIKTD